MVYAELQPKDDKITLLKRDPLFHYSDIKPPPCVQVVIPFPPRRNVSAICANIIQKACD